MHGVLFLATLLGLAIGGASCRSGIQDEEPLSPQDSIATAREAEASLAGDVADAAAQSYSYRELYAGMPRAVLERRAPVDDQARKPACDVIPPSGPRSRARSSCRAISRSTSTGSGSRAPSPARSSVRRACSIGATRASRGTRRTSASAR